MVSPAFAVLPDEVQKLLLSNVKRKFDAYFRFTRGSKCTRQVRQSVGGYWHSDDSMISDIEVLWSLFCEVYELFDQNGVRPGGQVEVATFFAADPDLVDEFNRIFRENGEFWESPDTKRPSLCRVTQKDAVPARLWNVWGLLRNGRSHSHWCYDNLDAVAYWKQQGWDTVNQQPVFGLASRGADNYMAYVADAKVRHWDSSKFWQLPGLRIMVMPYITFRFSLHRFLNILVNDDRHNNVFNH